jgi:acyl dehydratase
MSTDHDSFLLGHGFYYEELPIGFRFHTKGRTLCEADLNAYVNLTWFTEELFVNLHSHAERSLKGRVVPAGLVFCFAEGLVHPSMENTGQAFLGMTLDVRHPSYIGDTIHTECQVIEARVESKGRRGLVRTENRVVNQNGEAVIIYRPMRLVLLRTPIEPAAGA